jgi:CubicO group peptidase (beta-lactamase class C family)
MLQDENKLSVDDRLSKYVPEVLHGAEMTLRQLLNMVSGLSDNDPAIYGDGLTQPIMREQMFANLNKLPLAYRPGTRMVYNNTNYNLLGLIVERVSGKSYLEFLHDRIFDPLGMSLSSTVSKPLKDTATGYFHEKPGDVFDTPPELSSDFLFGTGDIVSTPLDLLKWDAGLHGGRLLSAASLSEMFKVPGGGVITTILETDPRFPVMKNMNDGEPTVYAMGWMRPNPHTIWAPGHTFLFEAANVLFDDGYSIAIVGNVRDGSSAFQPGNLAASMHNVLNPDLIIPPLLVEARPGKPGALTAGPSEP